MKRAPRTSGIFGRYLLLEQLGQGGMAQIWRARLAGDERTLQEVVVKTLHPRLVGQPLFAELFAAEARITRLLSHPGIVRIIDAGKVKGMPYLAMERVEGWDLSALHRALPAGRRAPVEVVLSLAIEMCRAVGYAHDWRDERGRHRPIVHGDLSPSNLMVRRDGGVTLIDFGVAHMDPRVARGRGHLVIGKSGYLAPELLDDAIADARSDVFSLGVVLHELLAGRHLFVVESERETLRRLTEAPIPPPSHSNLRVTPELDEILLRALSRDPERRFASASEMANALERIEAPARSSRRRVAAFVLPLMTTTATGVPRSEEPVTAPIAPAIPSRVAAMRGTVRPFGYDSTGTINERPRRRAAPAAASRPRRRHTGGAIVRGMLAAAALIIALLAPLPRMPADWLLFAALDARATPAEPSAVATEPAACAPSTMTPPASATPPAAATPSPMPIAGPRAPLRPSARERHHSRYTRSARAGRTVATGRVVDPFHSQ